jgi:hypothetical protein
VVNHQTDCKQIARFGSSTGGQRNATLRGGWLKYDSQSVPARDRALRRAQAIRRKLGGSGGVAEPLTRKPKRMHWRTYERPPVERPPVEAGEQVAALHSRSNDQVGSFLRPIQHDCPKCKQIARLCSQFGGNGYIEASGIIVVVSIRARSGCEVHRVSRSYIDFK